MVHLTRESVAAIPGMDPIWAVKLWTEIARALDQQGYPLQSQGQELAYAMAQVMSVGTGGSARFSLPSHPAVRALRGSQTTGAVGKMEQSTGEQSETFCPVEAPAPVQRQPAEAAPGAPPPPARIATTEQRELPASETHTITALTGQAAIEHKEGLGMKAVAKVEKLQGVAGKVAQKAGKVAGMIDTAAEFLDSDAGQALKTVGEAAYKALDGLSELASTVPFIAPLGIAVKMIFKICNNVMAQKRNCQKLQKMVEDMVVVVMEAKDSLHKFEKQVGELVDLIKKCHDYCAKFARAGFLKKLAKGIADDKTFERLGQQLADKMEYFAKACVATTTKNVTAINEKMDKMMAELSSGSMFVSESKEIKELCDSMGGLDAVMGDPEKMKQLSAKMSISDQLLKGEMDEIKALMDEGPHKLIYHEDIRVFWRMNFRSTEVAWDIFFLGFTQRFHDMQGWLAENEKSMRRVLDVNGDGVITALEVNIAFPADRSLREALEFLTSPGFVKNNLPDLPRNFFARERSQQRAIKQVFENGQDSVSWLQIVGDVGLGKTTLAMGVGHEVVQQRQCGGVFFVDLTGKTTSEAAVYEIGAQLDIAVNDIDHLVQELPKKIEKLSPPKMMVILDNIEDVLEEDEEDFVDALTALLNSDGLQQSLRVVSTSRVEVSEAIRDDYLAPGTGPPSAVMPVEEMTQTEITKWVMTFVRSEESQMKIRGELKKALKKSGSTLKPLQVQMIGSGLQRGKPPDVVVERVLSGGDWVSNSIEDMSEDMRAMCLRMLVFPSTFDEVAAEAVCGASPDILDELLSLNIIKKCEAGRYKMEAEITNWFNETKSGQARRSARDLSGVQHDGSAFRKHYMSELWRAYHMYDSAKADIGLMVFDKEHANFQLLYSDGPAGMCGDNTLQTAIDILRMDQMLDARLTIDDHNSLLKVAQTLVDFPPSPAPAPERTAELQAAKLEYEGMVHQKQARYSEALECYRQSRALLESDLLRDKTRLRQLCVAKIGAVLTIMGQYREALGELQGVFDALSKMHDDAEASAGAKSDEAMVAARDAALAAALLANVHEKSGRFGEALKLYSDAVELEQEARGGEHPSVAKTLTAVGAVKASQGQYKEAVAKYTEALNICKAFFDEGHPLVAATQRRIADVKVLLGDLDTAEEMYKEVLASLKAELGPNHPQCGETLQGLGQAALGRADFDEALSCFQKAAKIFDKSLGSHHPQTAWVNLPMSEIYRRRAEYAQASEHAETALSTLVEVVGDQHPDVGDVLESKGEIAMALGRFGEAYDMYCRAQKVFVATFGEKHPAVGRTWRARGEVSALEGNYKTAIEELQKAQDIFSETLGATHWRLARARVRTGDCMLELGDTAGAQGEYEAAMGNLKASLGDKHPMTAECIKGLGDLHLHRAEFADATDKYTQAMKIFASVRGPDHPSVNAIRLELANVLTRRGMYVDSEAMLETAEQSALVKFAYGEHPFWGAFKESQGNLSLAQGLLKDAADFYTESLEMRKRLLGEKHTSVGIAFRALGQACMEDGRYLDALECFRSAREVLSATLGAEHWRVGRLHAYEAQSYERLGKRAEAAEAVRMAVDKLQAALSKSHPFVGEALAIQGDVYAGSAEFDRAVASFSGAREIFERVRGAKHPSVAKMMRMTAEIETRRGAYEAATALIKGAEGILAESLGQMHPEMGEVHEAFGSLLLATGDTAGAREQFERALRVRTAAFGEAHESVGRAQRALGQSYMESGQYKEALDCFRKAKAALTEAFGEEHWRVGRLHAYEAQSYERLGKRAEAQAAAEVGVAKLRGALGAEHPFVGEALAIQGDVYAGSAEFDRAVASFSGAREIFERVRGAKHPSVAKMMRMTAEIETRRGAYKGAKRLLMEAEIALSASLGDRHPEMGEVHEAFGSLLLATGDTAGAREQFERALRVRTAAFGEAHESVGRAQRALGQAAADAGQYEEAARFFTAAKQTYMQALDESHWRVGRAMALYGDVCTRLGRFDDAATSLEGGVKLMEASLGEGHPYAAEGVEMRGDLLAAQGRFDEAVALLSKALDVFSTVRGERHPSCGRVLRKIGAALSTQGKVEEALDRVTKAEEILAEAYAEGHRELGDVKDAMGNILYSLKRHDEALDAYQGALDVWRAALGDEHELTGRGMRAVAQAMIELGRGAEAKNLLDRARSIYVRVYQGEEHWRVMRVDVWLGRALVAAGDAAAGQSKVQKAVEGLERALGQKHPVVAEARACLEAVG
ncbi:unnamed protein product [Pedinophyceae sp. YPF-701]|nr:unnamed protein product [Pedinophyceae sp. YPF-701]